MPVIQEFAEVPQLSPHQLNFNVQDGTVTVKNTNKPVLIVAYANYCGYCHRFGPLFKSLAQAIKGPVQVMAFHGPDEPLLKAMLDIQGYPTVMMIDRKGQVHTFENERSMHYLLAFVRAHMA